MKNIVTISILSAMLLLSCGYLSGTADADSGPFILSDSTRQADCVLLTTDEKEQPLISWCETDKITRHKYFFMAFYVKKNNSFSSPLPVPIEQNTSIHEEGMPKIAVKGDGTIMAVYETTNPTKENEWAGFIRYIVSRDRGKTWTSPAYLHTDSLPGKSRSFSGITRLSDGQIGACWLDESFDYKKGGRPVKFAKTNAENKFVGERLIDSLACECCRVAISCSRNGKINIVFRDIIKDSIRDVSVSSSHDNGKSFTPAVPFSDDGWVINGCPHNGPAVVNTDMNTYAVWFTGGPKTGIYYSELNQDNKPIIKQLISRHGRFIQLSMLDDSTRILAYNENLKQGDLFYNKIVLDKLQGDKIFSRDITSDKGDASYPVVQCFDKNSIIVAWTENNKIFYRIVKAKSIG